jgi:hypothetical protein
MVCPSSIDNNRKEFNHEADSSDNFIFRVYAGHKRAKADDFS